MKAANPVKPPKAPEPVIRPKLNVCAEYIGRQIEQYSRGRHLHEQGLERHGTVHVNMDENLVNFNEQRLGEPVDELAGGMESH